MSEAIKDAVRQRLEMDLARQLPHPVHPRVEVVWTEPWDIMRCTIRVGGIVEQVQPEMVARRVAQRNQRIAKEAKDPLRYLCEPDEYRLIDLEVVRKRLKNPGVQLILWVNGGIRSSKTEFCTRRISANFWYTPDAWCWAFHETDTTSREIQQVRVKKFIPQEMAPDTGKHKADLETKFSYSEGAGFRGSEFYIKWDAANEKGEIQHCGGRFGFRFYGQSDGTMVGQEITCCTWDEKIPPNLVKLIDDRLLTRAADTRDPKFMERMLEAEAILARGDKLPLPLLGAIYHGWQLGSFTPKLGWSASCATFLLNARKYGWYDPRPMVQVAMQQAVDAMPTPELREAKLKELEAKPWTLGTVTQVPRFAQPMDERRLVAYLPTYANKFKGNWPGAVQSMQGQSDEQIRITLFGDVDKDWTSQFPYHREKHVQDWDVVPRVGTIFEYVDPAPRKAWVIKWFLVDAVGRKWVLQEWPCPSWEIEGHGLPGPWALPSETDKRNGDAGPAQSLRLGWDYSHYTRLIWQGRQRLAKAFEGSRGGRFQGALERRSLTWAGRDSWKLDGEFVMPAETRLDKRFASAPTVAMGRAMTILDALLLEDNAPDWQASFSPSIEAGNLMIEAAMASDLMGMPGLMCLRECENTQFTWATYTVPEFKTDTTATDEACKDFRDPDAYFLASEPEHLGNVELVSHGGSRR